MYNGGKDFSYYYVNARDRVKTSWPYLKIFSPCIEDHKKLAQTGGTGYGQFSGAFISGFIDGVTEQTADHTLEKLPDVISLHGYVGQYAPEGLHVDTYKEWISRLDDLHAICNRGGYKPNFAQTEYLFSVSQGTWGPVGASITTQAVYYMRRALMDATMKVGSTGKGWEDSFYYHHPMDWEDGGWLYWGSDRSIRKVGRILHGTGLNDLGINLGTRVWRTAASDRSGTPNIMTCGWYDRNGKRWGAIWKYTNDDDYYAINTASTVFEVGSDNYGSATAYKFVNLGDASNVRLDPVGASVDFYSDSPNYYLVPQVDEEPVFIKFNN